MFAVKISLGLMKNLKLISKEELEAKLQNTKWVLKYKMVDKKKRPVPNMIPEEAKVT